MVIAVAVLFHAIDAGAERAMKLKVTPTIALAPASVLIYISIAQDADNRRLKVSAGSDDFWRASEVTLDGEESPRVSTFEYRDLPPGSYEIRASLIARDGRVRDTVSCTVLVT